MDLLTRACEKHESALWVLWLRTVLLFSVFTTLGNVWLITLLWLIVIFITVYTTNTILLLGPVNSLAMTLLDISGFAFAHTSVQFHSNINEMSQNVFFFKCTLSKHPLYLFVHKGRWLSSKMSHHLHSGDSASLIEPLCSNSWFHNEYFKQLMCIKLYMEYNISLRLSNI